MFESLSPVAETGKLYLDFDSFFASAEQHFNPVLQGKPVGVVPLDVRHTGCIAISREAKALGVPSGASVTDARTIVPEMIFVVARPDVYVRLHHRIIKVIETCLPIEKVRSIDEVVCDLVSSEWAQGASLGEKIKRALSENFSEALTCSIGLAPTELLAKIAAEMNKPDGLTVIGMDQLPGAIAHIPLNNIPGISKGMGSRLDKAGVHDLNGLWNLGSKQMRALWGSVEGERFWNALHGCAFERPDTQKRMFGHSRMLPLDWRTPDKVQECARQLALGAARRLRRTQLKATKLTLSVRGGGYRTDISRRSDDKRWSSEAVFIAMRDDRSCLRHLGQAFERYQREVEFIPRSVSVVLHGLIDAEPLQNDLFDDPRVGDCHARFMQRQQRDERLSGVLDAIRSMHGPAAANYGMNTDMPGGYLGAKIAFGRIPDLDDFNENQSEDCETRFCSVA